MTRLPPSPPTLKLRYFGVVLAAASWGTWSVFLRRAEANGPIPPQLATFVVMATIGIVLMPFALLATWRRAQARSLGEWSLVGAFGVSDALNCGLYFAALHTTTVAVAALTHYLAPLLVALSAPLVLREPRRAGTLLAAGLGLFGLGLLLAPWQSGSPTAGRAVLEGGLMGAASAVFYAAGVFFNKRLSRSFEASELLVYHMPSALLVLGLCVPQAGWQLSTAALGWLGAGALGPGALAGVVFVRSLRHVPAGRAAVLTLIEPMTAVAIAAAAWGEQLGPASLAGALLILGAAYLVVREGPRSATATATATSTSTQAGAGVAGA